MLNSNMKSYLLALALLVSIFPFTAFAATEDPVAAKLEKIQEFVQNNNDTSEDWKALRGVVEPLLVKAKDSLAAGRRWYALQIIAVSEGVLGGQVYLAGLSPESKKQISFLESEWKKTGDVLAPALNGRGAPSFPDSPAIVKALGQTAWNEIEVFYESSIEYGRNTVADAGLYYLGQATGQLSFTRFCEALREPVTGKAPRIGNLVAEMDQFENELLDQYKPPASMDSHPIFIRSSAMLKEARELQSAGMQEGALYMYLMSRLRLNRVAPGTPLTVQEATQQAEAVQKKLQPGTDNSIAQMFLQMAVSESADTSTPQGGQTVRAIFEIAMPHYFAALEAPKSQAKKPNPEVTVTLVRWPYT